MNGRVGQQVSVVQGENTAFTLREYDVETLQFSSLVGTTCTVWFKVAKGENLAVPCTYVDTTSVRCELTAAQVGTLALGTQPIEAVFVVGPNTRITYLPNAIQVTARMLSK